MSGVKTSASRVAIQLFVLSAASLFAELLVIRWLTADIRAFTVFRTFPLVTCFIALGLGFALKDRSLFRLTPIAILQFAGSLKLAEVLGIGYWRFPSKSIFAWQDVTGDQSPLFILFFACVIFLLLAGPFAICLCIGSRLGQLFNEFKPLKAYSLNIAGALAGSMVFALGSFMCMSPWLLTILLTLTVVAYLRKSRDLIVGALAIVAIGVMSLPPAPVSNDTIVVAGQAYRAPAIKRPGTETYWSPYQRIDLNIYEKPGQNGKEPDFLGLDLGANHAFYQYYLNFKADVDGLPPDMVRLFDDRRRQYHFPYTLTSARDVLVVGAGTGQNVEPGPGLNIDAVDIDPVILDIGRRYNPDYAAPGVRLITDDARHFFRTSDRRYDLILFSLLDSHAVVGQGSSVRLDSYVYTKQSMQQALSLLKPNGMICLSFNTSGPWIADRLFRTMESAAGYPPLAMADARATRWGGVDTFFLVGKPIKDGLIKIPDGWKRIEFAKTSSGRILTDDWPYLYVAPDAVDVPYLTVVLAILLTGAWCGRKFFFVRAEPENWQMFFLGSAFLLLELHAISLLSLLYGSTWLTSAIVINGILIMILLANLMVVRFEKLITRYRQSVYFVLFASILASYLLPADQVLQAPGGTTGLAVVTIVTLLPMCVAGIIFSGYFSTASDASKAIAFNIFGAVIGGLLEYLSNFFGIKSLEMVALMLYVMSFLCIARDRKAILATSEAAAV